MFHNRNDLEIVNLLQNQPKHIRQIAKDLNIPPSTVMRTTNKLIEENVVDFKEIGKNKEFFLKNSLEKSIYINLAENYKKIKLIKKPLIRKYVEDITKIAKNELIILFGSYANNTENKNSDIDIFIETKNNSLKKEIENISSKLSIKIGNLNPNSLLGKEIQKNHIIIQNVDRYLALIN